jgi:hypothetical protein
MSDPVSKSLPVAPKGAQDADNLANVASDPNMSGRRETQQLHDPMAGPCEPLNPESQLGVTLSAR